MLQTEWVTRNVFHNASSLVFRVNKFEKLFLDVRRSEMMLRMLRRPSSASAHADAHNSGMLEQVSVISASTSSDTDYNAVSTCGMQECVNW